GRRFLDKNKKKYDIILVDAFKSLSPPPHLLTREFVESLKEGISNDSIVAVNLIAKNSSARGSSGRISNPFLQRMYDTYKSEFRKVYVIEASAGKLSNYIIFASDIGNPEFVARYG
ncbi:MAG TPA: fused MFS/spermidine synthase, partial [Candidatus Micrarchaeota archaeon]|nr:fused MFS/spermidine synthase [Candidatus Micrarchaeota archaeon]